MSPFRYALLLGMVIPVQVASHTQKWSGVVSLDSAHTVQQRDTLRVEPGSSVQMTANASLQVKGVLLVQGDTLAPVLFQGGNGIHLFPGSKALISGSRLKGFSQGIQVEKGSSFLLHASHVQGSESYGIHVKGGTVDLVQSRFSGGGTQIRMESGELEMEDCTLSGGRIGLWVQGHAHVEDSRIEGDTLWWASPGAKLSFHDVSLGKGKRYGKPQVTRSAQQARTNNQESVDPVAFRASVSVDRRMTPDNSYDVVGTPLFLSLNLIPGIELGLATGFKAGFQNNRSQLQGRDRSQATLRYTHSSGLSVQGIGGVGSEKLDWNQEQFAIATTTLDPSMDMETPVVSSGTYAGGLAGYRGSFLFRSKLDWMAGYLWREEADLAVLQLNVQRMAHGISTQGQSQFVITSDKYWQWAAQLDQRRADLRHVWGYRLRSEFRNDNAVSGAVQADYQWKLGSWYIGPQLGSLFALNAEDAGGATGMGILGSFGIHPRLRLEWSAWGRWHRDLQSTTWFGTDFDLTLQGGF